VGVQITQPFDEPYNLSSASLPSTFSPSVVGIAGVPYLLDTESGRYQRESFPVVQQRNTDSNRDLLLLPQDVWRQQMQSWHQGAGQTNTDRDDSLPYRFYTSFGINPWTQWRCSLLPATDRLYGTDGLTGKIWLTNSNQYLAVINDEAVYWYDELSVGSTAYVGSTVISSGNAVLDIADDGHVVTALTEDRYVWTVDGPGGTPTKWANHQYTTSVDFIAWEKDYLLVGDGNKLYNALKGNNPVLIYTHPDTDFRWVSAASGNSCIYVMGSLGDRTTIHRVNIKQDGTGLLPCIVAANLPDGEIGYSIDTYLGFVLIGTDKGVRVAQSVNDSGDLVLGPVIPTDAPVRCFEGQDRFVWYGVSSMDGAYSLDNDYFPAGRVSGLGRMDLSVTTTTQLTPAYANDICVVSEAESITRSVVTYNDKRVFSVDGSGVWFETADYMQGGWLHQGTMSFGIEDLKTGLYLQAKWEPLKGEIDLDIAYDSTGYIRVAKFTQQGSIRSGNVSLDGVQYSRLDSRFVLQTPDVTETPIFTRWEHRAIPVKGRTSRWTLPIYNYEDIEIDMVSYTRDPLQVYLSLVNLVESGQLFTLQESGVAYQVHAKDFSWQPEKLSINGKGWQGVFTLVVESVQ
jgi:hypothetical protein